MRIEKNNRFNNRFHLFASGPVSLSAEIDKFGHVA